MASGLVPLVSLCVAKKRTLLLATCSPQYQHISGAVQAVQAVGGRPFKDVRCHVRDTNQRSGYNTRTRLCIRAAGNRE